MRISSTRAEGVSTARGLEDDPPGGPAHGPDGPRAYGHPRRHQSTTARAAIDRAATPPATVPVHAARAGGRRSPPLPVALPLPAPAHRAPQGLISGISAAFGYGVGVLAAYVWRAFADREARPAGRRSWLIFAGVAVVAFVAATVLGRYWQGQIRDLMDAPPTARCPCRGARRSLPSSSSLLVALSRALDRLYRWVAGQLNRWIGPRAARAVGWAVVVVGAALLLSGVVLDQLVAAADQAFALRNGIRPGGRRSSRPSDAVRRAGLAGPLGVARPGGPRRSWAPARPRRDRRFTGAPALEPVRAYAGLDSAPTTEDRARLAVDDLVRAGGFDRSSSSSSPPRARAGSTPARSTPSST